MGPPGFLRNPAATLICCFALAFISFFVLSPDGSNSIVVFILVALMAFIVRPVYDIQVKVLCYLLLGMLSYWTFGGLFAASGSLPEFPLPVLFALSAVGAMLALVAHSDGKLFGSVFAGSSLVLLFFSYKDAWSIAVAMLAFLSQYALVHYISRINEGDGPFKAIALGSIASGVLLASCGLANVLSGVALGVHLAPPVATLAFGFAAVVAMSMVFNLLALLSFDAVLRRAKLKRFVKDGMVTYGSIGVPLKFEQAPKAQKSRKGSK